MTKFIFKNGRVQPVGKVLSFPQTEILDISPTDSTDSPTIDNALALQAKDIPIAPPVITQLYKFCPKEYNPKFGYRYLQLGTLTYYREMESNKNISDGGEGMHLINILDYNPKDADKSLSNNLQLPFGNAIYNRCFLRLSSPNCYLFCLSINNSKSITGNRFCDNYDSLYRIKDLDRFINIVAQNIWKEITIQHFEESAIEQLRDKDTFLNNTVLEVIHGSISYNDTKYTIIQNSKVWEEKSVPAPAEIIFTKDVKYTNDEEYRIAFFFVHEGLIVPVKSTPILITCEGILDIIE